MATTAVWVQSFMAGGYGRIEVADNGLGLTPDDLLRVTQPFQLGRGQQGVRGAGLGLALVSAVAEQHGGTFTLTARPAGGLNATLSFPLAKYRSLLTGAYSLLP